MSGAELLVEPLRALLTALGTGVLAPGNPAERLHTAASAVDAARADSQAATRAARDDWAGTGGAAAFATAESVHRGMTVVTADAAEFSRLVQTAAHKVHSASTRLHALVDSLERSAAALGDRLFTPAGLMALVPIAVDHLGRGVDIVARTRAELQADTEAMAALGRRTAPAASGAPADAGRLSSVPVPGGVAVTLPDGSVAYAPNERAATAVRSALSQRGVPYVWGGTTPDGFDCSGFTQWAYRQAGVELPRLAQDQDTAGYPVSQADLQPGDLAVWSGHVAMYIGNGQLIEAGDPVGVSPLRTTNLDQTFEGFYRPR